jgi:hypothetical protein
MHDHDEAPDDVGPSAHLPPGHQLSALMMFVAALLGDQRYTATIAHRHGPQCQAAWLIGVGPTVPEDEPQGSYPVALIPIIEDDGASLYGQLHEVAGLENGINLSETIREVHAHAETRAELEQNLASLVDIINDMLPAATERVETKRKFDAQRRNAGNN